MSEERMTILNMIAQGTISPDEGEKLLRAMEEGDARKQSRPHGGEGPGGLGSDFREGQNGADWESRFEGFMDNFGEKMEKFAENFGGDFEERMEAMAEDLEANLKRTFGGGHESFRPDRSPGDDVEFKGIPEWGLAGGLEGESMDFSSGRLDVAGVAGVVLLSLKSGKVDFKISPEPDSVLGFDPGAVKRALRREDWLLLVFHGDSLVTIPEDSLRLALFSFNGDVDVDVPVADLFVSTVNGDVNVSTLNGPGLLKTVNGDVSLWTERVPTGKVELSTINGDVKCRLPAAASMDFTLKTVNGDIDAGDERVRIKGEYDKPASHLKTGVLGEGTMGSLRISTIQGDISLKTVE